jgi:hypothetical protein
MVVGRYDEGMADEPMEPPLALALIVCETVSQDIPTGKKTIHGLFTNVVGSEFPAVYPRLTVYAVLTGLRGTVNIRFVLVDALEERPPIFDKSFRIKVPDPLAVADGEISMVNVQFPVPGEYVVQLFADDAPLLERKIVAVQTGGGLP